MEQLFCDGIVAITILDGTVRLDLGRFGLSAPGSGDPAPEVVLRVIMGAKAYLRSFEQLEGARQYLADGVHPNRDSLSVDAQCQVSDRAVVRDPSAQISEPLPSCSSSSKALFP